MWGQKRGLRRASKLGPAWVIQLARRWDYLWADLMDSLWEAALDLKMVHKSGVELVRESESSLVIG